MKSKNNFTGIFIKYWSLVGLIIAVAILVIIYLNRGGIRSFTRWYLWLLVPIMMIHNFEESFFPGKFLPWVNGACYKSNNGSSPMGPVPAAIIGIVNCWIITAIAALTSEYSIVLPLIVLFFFFANAWMHVSYTMTQRLYSPGAITSFVLIIPFCIFSLVRFGLNSKISIALAVTTYLVGNLLHFVMFALPARGLKKKDNTPN
jgi:hypothetical protein